MSAKRQFSSGSRQAPDPCDQYLEQRDFYRKHTARDASCLFRVISEQMYDTQMHHLPIRQKCVMYMRKNKKFFEPMLDREFYEYLDELSKPKTYGTLIELHALSLMYERNVILFEPFNLGRYFNYRVYHKGVFRVFYTSERHFDSIFTMEYIRDAAVCQSICYEILYKDLFKLPDVSYAVEHMLHLHSLEESKGNAEYNNEGYCIRLRLDDGRFFDFDLPQFSNCILENHELCHFHCSNFPKLSSELQRVHDVGDQIDNRIALRNTESLLPQKYVSCVRQLLDEGITPFPYKVAKALDPTMYRNIEFDAWSEARKELRLQNWYHGDSNFKVRHIMKHGIFQVGAKCNVKLRKSDDDLYTCHIQEIGVDKGYCIVFIEQLGEKRMVPYEALSPLPAEQFKPWSLPYRFQRHMQKYSSMRYTRHHYNYRYRFRYNSQLSSETISPESSKAKAIEYRYDSHVQAQSPFNVAATVLAEQRNSCYYKLKQYTQLENFGTHTVEYCTMPVKVQLEKVDADEKCDSNNNSVAPASVPSSSIVPSSVVATTDVQLPSTLTAEFADESGANTEPLALPTPSSSHSIEAQSSVVANSDIVENVNCQRFEDMGEAKDMSYGINQTPLECSQFTYQPPYQYSAPEEYFMPMNYNMTGNMYHQPTPTFLPTNNNGGGTIYYMCGANAMSTMPCSYAPVGQHGNFLINNESQSSHVLGNLYSAANGVNSCVQPLQTVAHSGDPSYDGAATNAPFQRGELESFSSGGGTQDAVEVGPINFNAKRSERSNGSDLPTDYITLRYFFNLGVECLRHHQQSFDAKSEAGQEISPEARENNHEIVATADRHIDVKEKNAKGPDTNLDAHYNSAATVEPYRNPSARPTAGKALLPTPDIPPQYIRRSHNTRYFNTYSGRERNQYRGGSGWGASSNRMENSMRNSYGQSSGGASGSGGMGGRGGAPNSGTSRHRNSNHSSRHSNVTPISSRSSHYVHSSDHTVVNNNSNRSNRSNHSNHSNHSNNSNKNNNNNGHNAGPSSIGMAAVPKPTPLNESNAGNAVSTAQTYGDGGGGSDLCQTQSPTDGNYSNALTYMPYGPVGGEYPFDPIVPSTSAGLFAHAPPPPISAISGGGGGGGGGGGSGGGGSGMYMMPLPSTPSYGVYGQTSSLMSSGVAALPPSMQVAAGIGGGFSPHPLGPGPPYMRALPQAAHHGTRPQSHHAGGGAGGCFLPTPNATAEPPSMVEGESVCNHQQLQQQIQFNYPPAGSFFYSSFMSPNQPPLHPPLATNMAAAVGSVGPVGPPPLSLMQPQLTLHSMLASQAFWNAPSSSAIMPPQAVTVTPQQQPSALQTAGTGAVASTSGNTGNGAGKNSSGIGMMNTGGNFNRRGAKHQQPKE